MKLSLAIALIACLLAIALVAGYASGTERGTLAEREAARRLAAAEHQKRKEDFARRCGKSLVTAAELEACRAAYRRL
jgi:hypothetical protein